MKFLKTLLICIILLYDFLIYADDPPPARELIFQNNSCCTIKVNVYPVGCIFSGSKEYKLTTTNDYEDFDYITGCSNLIIPPGPSYWGLEHDGTGLGEDDPDGVYGIIGYGKYRVDIYEGTTLKAFCYVDYSTSNYPNIPGVGTNDIDLSYYTNGILKWHGYTLPYPGFTCKIWDQSIVGYGSVAQVKSGFKSAPNETNHYWLDFPHVATNSPYNAAGHETPEKCFVYIDILSGHQPKVVCGNSFELIGAPCLFRLKSNSNTKFYIGNTDNNPNCGAMFAINSGQLLWLEPNTQIVGEKGSKLTLRNQSNVRFDNNSHILMKPGSTFCFDRAVRFYGPGYNEYTIVIQGYVRRLCPDIDPDLSLFEDSLKLYLDTNAILELSDSTIWTFEGDQTALICDSGATIKFGKGSKLVFSDGARIKAKHTKFMTVDSNTTWDGIYLNDFAFDTLQYCTIENALNGINKEDLTTSMNDPATEISNCTFSNKTSTELVNMIYDILMQAASL